MARMGDNRRRGHRCANERPAPQWLAHVRLAARTTASVADSGKLVDRIRNLARVLLYVRGTRRGKSHTSTDHAQIVIRTVAEAPSLDELRPLEGAIDAMYVGS